MSSSLPLYRTVWRWHFYAGIIVLPVLAWLAITGALYLYHPEIERGLYRDWVELPTGLHTQPLARTIRSVQSQTGGRVTQVSIPAAATDSWRVAFTTGDGAERMAFVRPDTGLVLGTAPAGGPMDLVKQLHSLSVAGPVANVMIEIVAGWAIILVLTGFYLWWPRAGGKALSLAGRVGERRFWRNFHASVGALVGIIILFLAITGMPWTAFWGERFHSIVAANKLGRPEGPTRPRNHDAHLPWSLQGSSSLRSSSAGDLGPDMALAAAARHGIGRPLVLDLPEERGEAYRVSRLVLRAEDARVLHLGASDGQVIHEQRWAEFGMGAKAFEWGIYTHQGQQYGEVNRLIMLSGCLGVLLLTASAPVLWWKRRRKGRLEPPPASEAQQRGFLLLMLALGLLYPLTGLTMLLALIGGSWRSRGGPLPQS
jgi:uncharacterized iron-regulated membrane protein